MAKDIKEITEQLEKGVQEVFESEKYKAYLDFMSKFYDYSVNNIMLILMQKPDASLVAGYRAWQTKFKRFVKKGEKGLTILAPCPHKFKKEVENEKGEKEVKEIEIDPELSSYYKALDCDCIDIVCRKIGGKWFDVMCDDEGLFREVVKISAINDMGSPMLVCNLLFFHSDSEGNLVSLEQEDIAHLKRFIQTMYTRKHPGGYFMLTQCEY